MNVPAHADLNRMKSNGFVAAACRVSKPSRTPESQMQRFLPRHRRAVQALASRDTRLADLAVSFPALLFALAIPRDRFAPEALIDRVLAGASLRELGQLAGLPSWSRRLMPEAFSRPIPACLPDGELLSRQIANHLPRSPKRAAGWLEAVGSVAEWSTPEAAVWIAREMAADWQAVKPTRLALVSLYAWYSCAPQTHASSKMDKPWHPSMRFDRAVQNARRWLEALELDLDFGGRPLADVWLTAGDADGFEFQPLQSAADLCVEAEAMQNCVRIYGYRLRHNRSRVWSVRRQGERVATLEIGWGRADPLLQITQIKGPKNAGVSADVCWAARKWLHAHDLLATRPKQAAWGSVPMDRALWITLWRPYWLAKRRLPAWLPLWPSDRALGWLCQGGRPA
jgi:hypothetical protein